MVINSEHSDATLILPHLTREVKGLDALFEGLSAQTARAGDYAPDALFVAFVGPSGVGKGTAVRQFRELMPEFHLPVSVTTRSPRDGEVDGEHYHFISEHELLELVASGEILTGDGYVGNHYADMWPDPGEKRILLEVTLDAALLVQRLFPRQTVIFFFHPTGTTEAEWREFLTGRLDARGTEDPDVIARRVDRGIEEIAASIGKLVVPIYNADTANSVQTVIAILEALLSR